MKIRTMGGKEPAINGRFGPEQKTDKGKKRTLKGENKP